MSSQHKDYRVEVRVKNNWLLKMLEDRGYQSTSDFCRRHNMSSSLVGAFINLREAPISSNGKWRPVFIRMANALQCMPEDICPPQHLKEALKKNKAQVEVGVDELKLFLSSPQRDIPTPIDYIIEDEAIKTIDDYLSSLKPREEDVIRSRFGLTKDGKELTLQELADKYNVGKERIRQIEAKALRILRWPASLQMASGEDKSISLRAVAESLGVHQTSYGPLPKRHYVPEWKKEKDRN